MSIDLQGRRLWQRVAPAQKAAFFTCLMVGYLVHLFAFTNVIPNADGLSRVFDLQQMTISGRWFLHYATMPNGFTQMPAVIGLLSLVFLGIAAALVTDLLGLRSTVLAGLCGGMMAAFPSLGFTFLYMFTASAYCLAILLAVLSVWLARRGRLGWVLGVLALAMAMGTYQAYASVAIGLALLVVLRETLNPEATFSGTLRLGIRLALHLAVGAVLYYLILTVFLKVKNLELLTYLGMDAANSGYPFAQLPALILRTYRQVFEFFFCPGAENGVATPWMAALDWAALGLCGLFLYLRMTQERLWPDLWRPVGGGVMLLLLPLGMNFTQIISPYTAPTPLTKYAFVAAYLAVLLSADLCQAPVEAVRLNRILSSAVLLWSAALLVFCLNTNNLLYTASSQAHRATESYLTRLMGRIEDCPGYEPGMEVAIIGAIPEAHLKSAIESYGQVAHYSVPLDTVAHLNKHIYYYLNDWLNVPVEEPSEATMIAVSDSPQFQAMPLYPAQGSIQVLDGRLVVKLQSKYTPKADFELAYENRH